MIPRLYESTETAFTTFGICPLADATSCIVTEERNGEYTLDMEYPTDGMFFNELKVDRIILAQAHENDSQTQPFRIESISGDMGGIVQIEAVHISYMLNWIIVGRFTANISTSAHTRSPLNYWNQYVSYMLSASNPFTMQTDMSEACSTNYVISIDEALPFRMLLGGVEGSMLDHWHGEFEWDRFVVKYNEHRGVDTGVRITYGKNLTGLTWETDVSDTYTSVVAFWKKEQDDVVTYVESDVMALYPSTNPFAFERTIIVDASSDYENAPTKAQLNTYAQSYARRNAVNPTVSVKVNFVPIWQTEEYKDYIDFEQVNLCDYATIVYPPLNLELKAQVVKTVYNVLLDRYDSLEISTVKKSLADTIFAMQKQIIKNSISGTNARRLIR